MWLAGSNSEFCPHSQDRVYLCPRLLSPGWVTIPRLGHEPFSAGNFLPVHTQTIMAEMRLSAECLHIGVRSQTAGSQLEHVTPEATPAHWATGLGGWISAGSERSQPLCLKSLQEPGFICF